MTSVCPPPREEAEGARGRVVRPVSSPWPLPDGGVVVFRDRPVVVPVVVFLRAGTCLISCRHVLVRKFDPRTARTRSGAAGWRLCGIRGEERERRVLSSVHGCC